MLIHCTMDELLAIRDGEGSQAALRHVDACEECRDELDRLHQRVAALKALPPVRAPRDRWPIVLDGLRADRKRRRLTIAGWTSLAAAASVAFAVGVSQLIPSATHQAEHDDPLVGLVEQAQTLEELLRAIEPQQRVMNGRVASAIAVLEDQLTTVEEQMTEYRRFRVPADQMIELMRHRVDLMDALVRIHATRSTYVGF